MQKKIFLCVIFFILYMHGSSSSSIGKTFHEWANYQKTSDQSIIIYFYFYPASCANNSPLFSTSVSVDFSQLNVFSFETNSPSSSQIKISCNDGNIQSEACSGNSSCYNIGVGVCSLVQDGVFTIKDIVEIFDVQLNDILSQLQQNGYRFSDLLKAFDEDWETIVDDFDITIKQLLNDYGVSLHKFVTMTGATLQHLLDEFGLGFGEFVQETDSTLNTILSTFNYDLSSLVADFHIALSDIEKLFNIPFKDFVKQFDLDLQSVEKMFGLTISQVINQFNMDISKFLSVFDMSIQDFVQQTEASIEDILKWFNTTFQDFVHKTNLVLDEILNVFKVGLHDVFEIASMSIEDFVSFFGYSMKTFVQKFDLGLSDVLHIFDIGFADFIKLTQYSISDLFSIFENFFEDIVDLVGWLITHFLDAACEVIHILCPSPFSCFGLGIACDLRRMAVPFNHIRQQTGNLYISVKSSSQDTCSLKNSGSQSSSSSGGGGGVSCFPGNSRVHLYSFHTKSMEQLRVGDIILDAKGKPTKVIGWLHRDEHQAVKFSHIEFANTSNTLIISGEHLVFSSNGAIQSKMIVPGTTLLKTDTGLITVKSVKWFTSKGVYAPLTESGTLLVDGIACSCYAYFPSHRIANIFVPMLWKLLRPFHNHHDMLSMAPSMILRWTRYFK